MTTNRAVWLAFFLNLSFAIVEFIAGGVFGSSAVLADSVHDLGDAIAIGLSAFLETISNREEDSHYTLGYKRFSLLGALITAVILMTGSVLVILENITKMFHPQPVNDKGILWLGIIAVTINVLASLVVRKGKTKNESILSLHFLEDTLGWLAVILMSIFRFLLNLDGPILGQRGILPRHLSIAPKKLKMTNQHHLGYSHRHRNQNLYQSHAQLLARNEGHLLDSWSSCALSQT